MGLVVVKCAKTALLEQGLRLIGKQHGVSIKSDAYFTLVCREVRWTGIQHGTCNSGVNGLLYVAFRAG